MLRALKASADPIQPVGKTKDGKTAVGMRPWGFISQGRKLKAGGGEVGDLPGPLGG